MSLHYTINIANLAKLSEAEFALMVIRFETLKQSYPMQAASIPQVFAPSAASNVKEHPLCILYKERAKEKRASVSAFDAQRFAGYTVQKGTPPPIEVKIQVWKGRLLERNLATSEEIESAIASATGETFDETEPLPEMETGSAEKGMELL